MAHMILNKDTMFSVRETPWHKLGKVLTEYPTGIDDALDKCGLPWTVAQGGVIVTKAAGDPFSALNIAGEIAKLYESDGTLPDPAAMERLNAAMKGVPPMSLENEFRANFREDDGSVLGVVSNDYKVVQNREAFQFLDALIGSELFFETAGSLMNGKKVWVLARLPEWVEVGGDQSGMYVWIANGHDGSMAVTSSVSNVRIVCMNTLRWAMAKAENKPSTYKFRHTGDLALKFGEARKVMGMTLDYEKAFKANADKLAMERMTTPQFERDVAVKLFPTDDDMGDIAKSNRLKSRGKLIDIFSGRGKDGDTRGNSPQTKWCGVNAVGEYADWNRRYTKGTDQMRRSFEDTDLKQRGYDLVVAS